MTGIPMINGLRLRRLSLVAVSATIGALLAVSQTWSPRTEIGIHADFAYDASDPALIAGDASLIVTGTVLAKVDERPAEGTAVYNVRVDEVHLDRLNLKRVPKVMRVAQDGGYEVNGIEIVLDGFDPIEIKSQYWMALVPPGADDSQDAMLLLSGPDGGNAIPTQDAGASLNFLKGTQRPVEPHADMDETHRKRRAEFEAANIEVTD